MYDFVINISGTIPRQNGCRMPPVVSAPTPCAAVYKFDWLSATGTAILFAALLSIVWLRAEAERCADHLRRDAEGSGAADLLYRHGAGVRLYPPSSGLSSTLAHGAGRLIRVTFFLRSPAVGGIPDRFRTPRLTPVFAALRTAAARLVGVSGILLVAANTTGGVFGWMISPRSIAIACAAADLVGKESGSVPLPSNIA